MMKKIFKALPCLFIMAIMMGSAFGSVVNYNETYETVEQTTVIDNKPVINETTQELVNVENRTYDDVTVKNETVSNVTYEDHTPKFVGYETKYVKGDKNYKGSEIDKVVLEDGRTVRYNNNKNLAGCQPNPVWKYVPAKLYLKNGEVIDIVIHNEGNKAYQNYGLIEKCPAYEAHTEVVNNVTNKITTYINHVVEVIYQIIDKPMPVPEPVVNNTTDVNTTDVNTTDVPTEPEVNNTTDVPTWSDINVEPEVNNTTDVPTENITENVTENVTDIPGNEPVTNSTVPVDEDVTENVTDNSDDANTTNDTLQIHETGIKAVAGLMLVIVLMVLMVVRIKRD